MSITPLRQNSKKNFEALVRPHLRVLYKRAYRLTLCQHDAEELVQEVLIKLYTRRSEIGSIENLAGWMMRILYNLYIDLWRKESRSPIAQLDTDMLDTFETPARGPLQEVNHLGINNQIQSALILLNAEQKLLIVMHDMEGYTLPELSENLGIALGTLKSRLHRARNNMKKNIQMPEPFEQNNRLSV
ncbi:MAG: RNA polymerase sigma factor [Gammaproteobacteria bacterium]|nr:RNA polymerase sigma factor [Gammaproteobacteria bacterium]